MVVGLARASHHPLLPPFPSASLCRALHSHALVQGGRDKGCICFMTHGLCTTRAHLSKPGCSAAESWSLPVQPCGEEAWAPPLLSKPNWRACPYRQERGAWASPGVLMEGSHPGGTAAGGAVPRPAPVPQTCPHPDLLWTLMHQAINLLLCFSKLVIMENLAPMGLKKKVFSKCLGHLQNYIVFKRM